MTTDPLDGWDDELNDWTEDDRVRDQTDADRLRTGVTCQPSQPAACGDFHNAGQCVRDRAQAAYNAVADVAAGDE